MLLSFKEQHEELYGVQLPALSDKGQLVIQGILLSHYFSARSVASVL